MGDVELEELKERQENEVAALRSIFDASFQDHRTGDVWKVWRPPEFEIKIVPENTTQGYCEAHVSVSLKIKFSPRYPLDSPDIGLASPRGLSSSQLQELQQSLQDLRNNSVQFLLQSLVSISLKVRSPPLPLPLQSDWTGLLSVRA